MQQGAVRLLAISILTYLIFGLLGTSVGFCQVGESNFRFEYGLSVIGGVGEEDNTDVRYYAAYPRFGWLPHDRWRLELEGNFGHYRLESTDMTSVGLNGLVAFDILQLEYFSAFIAGGVVWPIVTSRVASSLKTVPFWDWPRRDWDSAFHRL